MHDSQAPVVTVDGPSGAGKGTVVRILAQHFGWHVLDSGAIYRLAGLAAARRRVDLDDCEALSALARRLDIVFESSDSGVRVLLDGDDVTNDIRSEAVGALASRVAKIESVRANLLQRQRDFAQMPGLIADGRDMGTAVFQDAPLKIYLTASVEARAQRRLLQLESMGHKGDLDTVREQIRARDNQDMSRSVSPLKPADDAVIIDSTELTVEQVCDQIILLVNQRGLG